MEPDVTTEAPEWTPPGALPPPEAKRAGLPLIAIGAALGIAVGAGVALWISSQAFYIYILYNSLIGAGIGWALGLAPKRAGFTNKAVLIGAAVVMCIIPYVLMRYGFFVQAMSTVAERGETLDINFIEFFVFFLENDSLFGLELGVLGNGLVLFLEIGISIYYAYSKIIAAIAHARIQSVPSEVVAFVVNALAHGWDTARLRTELGRRGWTDREHQDQAIGTGYDVVAAMQQS